VDPRAGLDVAERRNFLTLLGLEIRPLGHYPGCVGVLVDTAMNDRGLCKEFLNRQRDCLLPKKHGCGSETAGTA
jgi:hypothetical protein